jgi:hypothetical protein
VFSGKSGIVVFANCRYRTNVGPNLKGERKATHKITGRQCRIAGFLGEEGRLVIINSIAFVVGHSIFAKDF